MIPHEARLLRVYVNASERWRGRPLYQAIVAKARDLKLSGASVFLVDLSFGAHRRLRDAKSEYLSIDVPVVIEVIDVPDRVEALLVELGPMLADGLATVQPVRIVADPARSLVP